VLNSVFLASDFLGWRGGESVVYFMDGILVTCAPVTSVCGQRNFLMAYHIRKLDMYVFRIHKVTFWGGGGIHNLYS
jgi:hypothetical protein